MNGAGPHDPGLARARADGAARAAAARGLGRGVARRLLLALAGRAAQPDARPDRPRRCRRARSARGCARAWVGRVDRRPDGGAARPVDRRARRRRERYARLILTAGAAARIPPSADLADDAGNLIAAMLSAGIDRAGGALGSRGRAGRRGPAAPGRCSRSARRARRSALDAGRIDAFAGGRRQPRRDALAAAGRRAGRARPDRRRTGRRGRLSPRRATMPGPRRSTARRASARPGTVALLAGVGMQTGDWAGVPPQYLFRIVRALRGGRPGFRSPDDRRRGGGAAVTDAGEDRQRIAAFLEMMAAEAGAARNTLLAYERDLRGASELLGGRLADAAPDALAAPRRGLDAAEARHRRPQGGGAAPLLRLPPGRRDARRRSVAGAAAPGERAAAAQDPRSPGGRCPVRRDRAAQGRGRRARRCASPR